MNDEQAHPQSVEVLEPPKANQPAAVPPTRPRYNSPTPAAPTHPRRTAQEDNDADSEDDSFIGRHGKLLAAGVLLAVGGLTAWFIAQPKSEIPRKAPERIVTIQALPPPPPPPPPPPKIEPPPPREEKMIEQTPVEEKEPEPEPKPADDPPPLGTNIKGDGPGDRFGLSSSGNGNGRIGGTGGNGAARSRWGWYASKVQGQIADALKRHPKLRTASIAGLKVRVWPDATGRITRAELAGSTGDPALDALVRNEILTGLQLSEPTPAGMPSPIVLRLNLRRPN